MRLIALAVATLALAACSPGAAPSATAPTPTINSDKMVILTVSGDIGATNRGPLDEFKDAFLGHKDAKFDHAYEFTRESLAALGEREAVVKRANWPAPITLRGPTMKSVLATVKAQGDTVQFQALDGYLSKFPIASLQSDAVLLALEADGAPLPIGGHGPAWLVFPANVVPGDDPETDAGLAWSVFHIDITNAVPPPPAPTPPK